MAVIEAIDVEAEMPIMSAGIAYYRLPEEVKDFIVKCHDEHGIIGFEWDPEHPRRIGFILKADNQEKHVEDK